MENSKLTRYIIIALVTAVVLFIAWYFSNIVAYILISAVLSIICKPLLDRLRKIHIGNRRMPSALCATIGLVAIWVVAFTFFYFFIPLLADQAQELSNVDVAALGKSLTEPMGGLEQLVQKYVPGAAGFTFNDIITDKINSFFSPQDVTDMFGSVANMVGSLFVALFSISFITFFFMKEENLFATAITTLFPKRYEENINHALQAVSKLLVRYFVGVVVDAICVMVILTLGLTLVAGLSFQTAMVIGLVAGVLNVIPYVGPLIGAIFGLVIGVATNVDLMMVDGTMTSLLLRIALVFVVMKIIDDAILQPNIFASSVEAHPLEIFLVILIAGSIAGIFGMLIAIPAYTVLRVFAKQFLNNFRVVQKLTEHLNM